MKTLLFTLFMLGVSFAHAEKRALVIGNSNYHNEKLSYLPNAAKDAQLIRKTLEQLGFTVMYIEDANKQAMDEAVDTFTDSIRKGDIAFFYYAGHGTSQNGQNYLIPLKSGIKSAKSLPYQAKNAKEILDLMSDQAKNSIFVLDACRNVAFKRSTGRGLQSFGQNKGAYIMYSASEGQTASDNRVFAQSLAKELLKPQEIRDVALATRKTVYEDSDGEQYPATYDQLLGKVYLNGKSSTENDDELSPKISVDNKKLQESKIKLSKWRFDESEDKNSKRETNAREMNCKNMVGYQSLMNFTISKKMLKELNQTNKCLVPLILTTESMDDDERQYWFDILPSMTKEKRDRLEEILTTEWKKLSALEDKYKYEIYVSNHIAFLDDLLKQKNISKQDASDASKLKVAVNRLLPHEKKKILNRLVKLTSSLTDQALTYQDYFQALSNIVSLAGYLSDDNNFNIDLASFMLEVAKQSYGKKSIRPESLQNKYLNLTWYLVMSNEQANLHKAVRLSREALSINEGYFLLDSNYAHALALLNRHDEAMTLYKKNEGKKVEDLTWEVIILKDFDDLSEYGVHSPIFEEVKKKWKSGSSSTSKQSPVSRGMNNTKQKLIPDGSCAVIIASRETIPEVRQYIQENSISKKNLKVYEADNGWYAISVGTLDNSSQSEKMYELKHSSKIPDDSFCTQGNKMKRIIDL